MSMEKTFRLVAVTFLLALCVGCATSRSEIDVKVPSLELAANPEAGKGKKV